MPGTMPGMVGQAALVRRALRQRVQQRRRVGMMRVARTAARRAAASTSWPAYITTTRCAVSATTPMSWVISTSAMPRSRCSATSRSRICAWMVTSSAVVGSSAISRRGLQAIAMAIITRWLMPPESWCGIGGQARLRRRDADLAEQLDRARARARARLPPSCTFSVSMIWKPTVKHGFRLVIGSWKIMAMSLPTIRRRWRALRQQVVAVEDQPVGGDLARPGRSGP